MHISNISIEQFKSFRNKIELQNLSENVNIIVGKNGSGKSNLISAVNTLFSALKFTSDEKQAMIHDGNVLSTNTAEISLLLRKNDRFPLKEDFMIRRSLGLKEDSFFITEYGQKETSPSKEEVFGIFESANLTNNNLFIIQQGKISYFATLNDNERFDLIKDIAGANTYEKDRGECHELLTESTASIDKIKNMLKSIQEKIKFLEKDKDILRDYENNERRKRRIERAIHEIEISEIEEKLAKYENEDDVYVESEEDEDIEDQIMNLNNKKEQLLKDIDFENVEEFYDLNIVEGEMEKLKDQEGILSKQYKETHEEISRLKNLLRSSKNEKEIIDQVILFCNELKIKNNIKGIEQEIMDSRNKFIDSKLNTGTKTEEIDEHEVYKKLEDCIEKRNKLWSQEKQNEQTRIRLKEEYQECERNLITHGGNAFLAYQNIRHVKGVHGCVIELINIPDELYVAVESVARNSLFHIVVDNDQIATDLCKEIMDRITFIPLNRIESRDNILTIEDAISLSSVIQCKAEYKPILSYITNNSYLVSDIKTGILLSRTHNINVVTIEGDIVSKKGSITGGFEKKNSFFKNLKDKENELRNFDKKQIELKAMIKELEGEIITLKNRSTRTIQPQSLNPEQELKILEAKSELVEKLKPENNFKEKLVQLLNTKLMNQKDQEGKIINIEHRINRDEIKMKEIIFKKNQVSNKIIKNSKNKENIKKRIILNNTEIELEKLAMIRNDKLKKKFYNFNEKENLNNNDEMRDNIEKNVLLEKKLNLIKKLGVIQDEKDCEEYKNLNYTDLLEILKETNLKLKKNPCVNRRAILQYDDFYGQKENLNERLIELIEERERIVDFINDLDIKKSEKISLTFSMIKDNFSYFYKKLSPNNKVELVLNDKRVMIRMNDEILMNLKNLSGGQKTLLALSLIFSIQRIDPAPFYFFDEIDANLDEESRINVGKLIKEISSSDNATQFFITTFKEDFLFAGDKFFGVTYENKTTAIEEISYEAAYNFVSESKPSLLN